MGGLWENDSAWETLQQEFSTAGTCDLRAEAPIFRPSDQITQSVASEQGYSRDILLQHRYSTNSGHEFKEQPNDSADTKTIPMDEILSCKANLRGDFRCLPGDE